MSAILQQLTKNIARSEILQKSHLLWEKNQKNWGLPLSKLDKLLLGIYLILNDYSEGTFPPTFTDQQKAYEAEINSLFSLPGVSFSEAVDADMRKPFWFGNNKQYLQNFIELVSSFEKLNISPPKKILELGCGIGWLHQRRCTAVLLFRIHFIRK